MKTAQRSPGSAVTTACTGLPSDEEVLRGDALHSSQSGSAMSRGGGGLSSSTRARGTRGARQASKTTAGHVSSPGTSEDETAARQAAKAGDVYHTHRCAEERISRHGARGSGCASLECSGGDAVLSRGSDVGRVRCAWTGGDFGACGKLLSCTRPATTSRPSWRCRRPGISKRRPRQPTGGRQHGSRQRTTAARTCGNWISMGCTCRRPPGRLMKGRLL